MCRTSVAEVGVEKSEVSVGGKGPLFTGFRYYPTPPPPHLKMITRAAGPYPEKHAAKPCCVALVRMRKKFTRPPPAAEAG